MIVEIGGTSVVKCQLRGYTNCLTTAIVPRCFQYIGLSIYDTWGGLKSLKDIR